MERLKDAIDWSFYLQLFVDDLPTWGLMGERANKGDDKWEIYTHFHLAIHYNYSHIIKVLYQSEHLVKLESPGKFLNFSYSVS